MCSEADRRSIIELLNFEIFDYTNAISTSGVTVSAFMVLGFSEILAIARGFSYLNVYVLNFTLTTANFL